MSRPRLSRVVGIALLGVFAMAISLYAQSGDFPTGEAAVAERYVSWAVAAAQDGRWEDVESALERGADFSDVSSDVSYLLALARLKLNRPMGSVLVSARRALTADRWNRYDPDAARIVEAEALIAIRSFDEALDVLSSATLDGAEIAYLRLRSFAGLSFPRFLIALREALDAYPEDPRIVRLALDQFAQHPPEDGARALVETILSRLFILRELDPSLAYRAAPFVRDVEERRRLVASYRAAGGNDAAATPIALDLGVIDEGTAIEEVFAAAASRTDVNILRSVWTLLRDEASRSVFSEAAAVFNGSLFEDRDGDGIGESQARYQNGRVVFFSYDVDQDGIPEMELSFADDAPVHGAVAASADYPSDDVIPSRLQNAMERPLAHVEWTRYPLVSEVSFLDSRYLPAPAAFPFAPVRLTTLIGNGSAPVLRFPKADPSVSRLTRRSLISFSSTVERPGRSIDGSTERIDLIRGVPRRSTETFEGRVVSIIEYEDGRPSTRNLDLDLDGRMETIQRFTKGVDVQERDLSLDSVGIVEYSQSDWDGDGIYEYAESFFADGSIERSWDVDGDGERDRVERSPSN